MKGDWKFRFQVFDISTSKAEHQRSVGLLYYQYPSGSGKTFHGLRGWLAPNKNHHDAIWVIVDRLMKSSHFLTTKMAESLEKLARLYIQEVIRLHVISGSITSDRNPRFVSRFWKSLQKAMGTKLNFSTGFHLPTDGQLDEQFGHQKICYGYV